MKNMFSGYYPFTPAEYKDLWDDGLIILDTNVLLNMYRLPTTARDELMKVLESLKERIWIPHQVALEFQRNRLKVIGSEVKNTEDTLKTASDLVVSLKKKIGILEIDKRGLGTSSQSLIDDLDKAHQNIAETITKVHAKQLDISSSDDIRERLDILLDGRVGEGPNDQKELDEFIKDGEKRYENKIPPGFADLNKEKNPTEAHFIHDHIKYPRKFGDLLLWKQILKHVKTEKITKILFVTDDKKEDWWWREHGKTIGPNPELVREIQREFGANTFWMYSSVQFTEQANKYSANTVSSKSLADIEQVSLLPHDEEYPVDNFRTLYSQKHRNTTHQTYWKDSTPGLFFKLKSSSTWAIRQWADSYFDEIHDSPDEDYDFFANTPTGKMAFKTLTIESIFSPSFKKEIQSVIYRAQLDSLTADIDKITIAIVLSMNEFEIFGKSDTHNFLIDQTSEILNGYSFASVVFGTIEHQIFKPYATLIGKSN